MKYRPYNKYNGCLVSGNFISVLRLRREIINYSDAELQTLWDDYCIRLMKVFREQVVKASNNKDYDYINRMPSSLCGLMMQASKLFFHDIAVNFSASMEAVEKEYLARLHLYELDNEEASNYEFIKHFFEQNHHLEASMHDLVALASRNGTNA